jgi:putative membrane protein
MPRDPHAGEPRFEVKVTAESHFSWLRTRMSIERTLMSCVRTGTALIGFGFTVFQVAARFHPGSSEGPPIVPGIRFVVIFMFPK